MESDIHADTHCFGGNFRKTKYIRQKWEQCLEVLSRYSMWPNLALLLKSYWERQKIAPNTGKFVGNEFRAGRGLTQGDPASPIIFSMVVDAVMRAVLYMICGPHEA